MSKAKRMLYGEKEGATLETERAGKNLYLLYNGVRIAKRTPPGTENPHWIPLFSGWTITETGEGEKMIEVIPPRYIPIGEVAPTKH